MSKLIVLAGVPAASKLDYSRLPSYPIRDAWTGGDTHSNTVLKTLAARWRLVPSNPPDDIDDVDDTMCPESCHLPIQPAYYGYMDQSPANFLSARELLAMDLSQDDASSDVSAQDSRPSQDSTDTEEEVLSDFYDHSFSIHEAIPSSQLEDDASSQGQHTGLTPGTPVYDSSDDMFSLASASSGGIIRTSSGRRLGQAPKPRKLNDLDEIPNAASLTAMHPQTMTMNLVVGILSISPARTVRVRGPYGRRKEVELVEMTVADDTKTGFSISMWLPREMRVNWKDGAQEKPEGARSNLRRDLKLMRPRDIVLLQNVALSCYRGRVHGQSLRGDVTKADLLFRRKTDDDDVTGCYSVQNLRMATGKDAQIMKVKRVRDWMADFLGEPTSKSRRQRKMLPDDTQ